eukprot:CAMPEP_0194143622 /NCGR_PEP_ID=MMETSP0152-20130528/12749_1 /TAXON_ID=1049557 /ORGANISM="Thalassiothrix antarctica, Strain L6-D1" /LENGTH=186 /DNA_ID=CAMNT_0038843101 /DNA_START=13 /DNA_END=574 /DNA_ORIENTATION=-
MSKSLSLLLQKRIILPRYYELLSNNTRSIFRLQSSTAAGIKNLPPQQKNVVGQIGSISRIKKNMKKKKAKKDDIPQPTSTELFFHAGLPMIGFSLLAVWVLKNSLEGKTKEYETSRGQVSKSERQARMEKEHDNMMQKLNKIRNTDFDNTKRIERPEEILNVDKKIVQDVIYGIVDLDDGSLVDNE